jgi:phosphoenolpyruvate carboxylase
VLFFRTLIENSMMSMLKSFFPLTKYIADDAEFGEMWLMIYNEFELTRNLVLELSGSNELMEEDKAGRTSILMRDKIALPLLTIQQYALNQLHSLNGDGSMKEVYEKLVTRSMFGIINAARNSA